MPRQGSRISSTGSPRPIQSPPLRSPPSLETSVKKPSEESNGTYTSNGVSLIVKPRRSKRAVPVDDHEEIRLGGPIGDVRVADDRP